MYSQFPNRQISSGTSPTKRNATRLHGGIGYVVLSREYNRENYIKNCFRNATLTIITESGEVINNCIVSKSVWDDIQFPYSYKDRGTCVIWMNIPINNRVAVISTTGKLDDYLRNNKEGKAVYGRRSSNGVAELHTDGDNGSINFFSQSFGEKGGVKFNILNRSNTGVFSAYVQGSFDIETDNSITMSSKKRFHVSVSDEENTDAIGTLKYVLGDGFTITDEYGNLIKTTESGIEIEDCNGKNKIHLNENGIEITDKFGNNITTNNTGISIVDCNKNTINTDNTGAQIFVPVGKLIKTIAGDEESADMATLAGKLIEVLKSMNKNMADMATHLTTTKFVDPISGVLVMFPDDITFFTQQAATINTLAAQFETIKSKTQKLT